MSYAVVEDVAASWEQYRVFAARVAEHIPEGLIVHAAGPTDEGFRIIELWESEEVFRRHVASRDHLVRSPLHALPVSRELELAHLIYGSRRD